MSKASKRYCECKKLVDGSKQYNLNEAIDILKKMPRAKFDETVELSFNLNIDPKQSDQMVRGTLILPHGIGKKLRIAVFCKGEDIKSAKESGADFVGGQDLIEKVMSGWLEFDVAISTPELMKDVGKLGKILGPRGLMPNPKAGTIDSDVARAIGEIKSGKMEFKMDKLANIHLPIGRISFDKKNLYENALSLINTILRSKPSAVKGRFVKSISISSSMGPGIKLDISKLNE